MVIVVMLVFRLFSISSGWLDVSGIYFFIVILFNKDESIVFDKLIENM